MLSLCIVLLVLSTAAALAAEDDPPRWTFASENSLQIQQMALSNWAGGGESSWGTTGDFNPTAVYAKGKFRWINATEVKYGLFKTKGLPVRKHDDYLSINSIVEYKLDERLSLGGLVRLHSQLAPGYNFDRDPVKGDKISDFLSPGYLLAGVGVQFKYRPPGLLIQLSPATLKQTLVLDGEVRELNQTISGGLYGNDGDRVRHQFGAFSYLAAVLPVAKNVHLEVDSQFFFHYADIVLDVDARIELKGKINEHLQASLETRLLFDEDNDTDIEKAGKQENLQLKQVLGLKLTFGF